MTHIKLLTVGEVAEALKMSESRIYDLVRQNILPSVKFGRQVRISMEALEAFIHAGGKPLAGGWRNES